MKRIASILLLMCLLGGCWDYRGLDELTIVTGLAVDRSATIPQGYKLSFEVVDNSGTSDKYKTTFIQSEGKTIYEAVGNAAKQLYNQIYFGNTELMIVSRQLAEDYGLNAVVDAFLRNFSTRYNMAVVVSREDTAGELLRITQEDKSTATSFEIRKSISADNRSANATRVHELYRVYNSISLDTENLVLPALRLDRQGDSSQVVTDGLAIFQKDKFMAYLPDEAVQPLLFLTRRLENGDFAFFLEGEQNPLGVTLEITGSQPKLIAAEKDGKLSVRAEIAMRASATEIAPELKPLNGKTIQQLEQRAGQALSGEIEALVQGLQEGSGADILGFADAAYRQDPALWEAIKDDRETAFREAEFSIHCDVTINDTGLIMEY